MCVALDAPQMGLAGDKETLDRLPAAPCPGRTSARPVLVSCRSLPRSHQGIHIPEMQITPPLRTSSPSQGGSRPKAASTQKSASFPPEQPMELTHWSSVQPRAHGCWPPSSPTPWFLPMESFSFAVKITNKTKLTEPIHDTRWFHKM